MRPLEYKTASLNFPRTEKDSVVNGIKVNDLIGALEDLGYRCKTDARIIGDSGYSHKFDILAEKSHETIVIDLISSRTSILDALPSDFEISDQISISLIRMRAKMCDCKCNQAIVIHLTSYFSESDICASGYDPVEILSAEMNTKIIRSSTIGGATKKTQEFLNSKELEINNV